LLGLINEEKATLSLYTPNMKKTGYTLTYHPIELNMQPT